MFSLFSRLREPVIFQGGLKKKNYFEGWYFKHVGADGMNKLAVIPGISLSESDPHAFIQVFDGFSGESYYTQYSVDELQPEKDPFGLMIGENSFSLSGISLNIPEMEISGSLNYSDQTFFKSRWFERGVMGWYGYVPFMETYHGLISLDHVVDGSLEIQGNQYEFSRGRGYIEKDWGESFPSSWIWIQTNGFQQPKTSLMVSVAVIPWLFSSFIGHLAVLYFNGRVLNMSTYMGGKISSILKDEAGLSLNIETRSHRLEIYARKGETVSLRSPMKGEMTGRTIESLSSSIEVKLFSKSGHELLFSGIGKYAGLEIMDEEDELISGLVAQVK